MRQRGHSEAGNGAARAHVRAGLTRLLLRSLQALPKVWASLRPPLMQQLWDAICPLLRLPGSSPPQQLAPADQGQLEARATQRTCSAEGITDSRSSLLDLSPASAAGTASTETASLGDAALPAQRSGSEAPGPGPCMPPALGAPGPADCRVADTDEDHSPAAGPLAELCAAEENLGAWWRTWTAPAASCKVSEGSSCTSASVAVTAQM